MQDIDCYQPVYPCHPPIQCKVQNELQRRSSIIVSSAIHYAVHHAVHHAITERKNPPKRKKTYRYFEQQQQYICTIDALLEILLVSNHHIDTR